MIEPNTCGCRQCGGSRMRDDTLTARRVLAYAPFIVARRNATAAELRGRSYPPSLYSRLVIADVIEACPRVSDAMLNRVSTEV